MILTRGDVYDLAVGPLFRLYCTSGPKLKRPNVIGMGIILVGQISAGDPVWTYSIFLWVGFLHKAVLPALAGSHGGHFPFPTEPLFSHL